MTYVWLLIACIVREGWEKIRSLENWIDCLCRDWIREVYLIRPNVCALSLPYFPFLSSYIWTVQVVTTRQTKLTVYVHNNPRLNLEYIALNFLKICCLCSIYFSAKLWWIFARRFRSFFIACLFVFVRYFSVGKFPFISVRVAHSRSHIHNRVTPGVISAVVGTNEKLCSAATITPASRQVYHTPAELWVMNVVFI